MACKQYQDGLMDAALGAPRREAELRAHLETCAACRAELERKRQLVAAMDQAVAASVGAEPSPEFVARIRRRVAEQPAPGARWFTGWVPATVGALAVVALLVFWLLPRGPQQPPESSPAAPVVAANTPAPGVPKPPAVATPQRRWPAQHPPRAVAAAQPRAPEVLIPSDEREGLRQFFAASEKRRAQVVTVADDSRVDLTKPIQFEGLGISPLQVQPVETPPILTPGTGSQTR